MDTSNAITTSSEGWDSEDALKVLGRVADAFDNPSLHKTDMELKLFVVNVVRSRRLITSFPGEESVCQDATLGSYDSSFETTYDEGAELLELGDVSIWEQATSYPYTSGRCPPNKQRSCPARVLQQDDGVSDVTKMLLTSSPLDRLDRLARIELKKTGWVERADKWTIVEMGLQGAPLPVTPPKTPLKKSGLHDSEGWERSSSTKTTLVTAGKQAHRSPRRPETCGVKLPVRREYGYDKMGRDQRQTDVMKSTPPTLMRSPARFPDSHSHRAEFSMPGHADAPKHSRTNTTTPIRASRFSRTLLHAEAPREQTRGRFGQVVRNIVKRMLPPSSVGGTTRGTGYPQARCTGNVKGDSPSTRTSQAEMTPRSDISAESGWTFASASSCKETRPQGCLDYQTNRWSGFWH